jgi:O-Antigen ligase
LKAKIFIEGQEFKTLAIMAPVVLSALVAGALLASSPVKFTLVAVLTLLFAFLTIKYPEALFALFLTAGLFKGDPSLELPYIDLTIFLALLVIAGIVFGIISKRIALTTPPFKMLVPFLVISCLSALSLAYTMAPIYGATKLSRFVTLTSLAFFAPLYVFQERERFRNFLIAYVSVTVAQLFDIFHKGWLNPTVMDVNNYEYLIVGYCLATAFLMTFMYLFLIDSSIPRRIFYAGFLCPVIIYGLMITGARGPFLSLVVTFSLVPILSKQPHAQSGRLRYWAFRAGVIGAIFLAFEYQYFARMTSRLMELEGGGGPSALERVYMAKAALHALFTMPYFLTGLGAGGFSVYYTGMDSAAGEYPHNMFLELATDIGVAGLVAGVLLTVWSFKKAALAVKRMTGTDYYIAVCAGAILLFTFLNALKSGDLNDNRLFFAMAGFFFYLDGKSWVKGVATSPRGAK